MSSSPLVLPVLISQLHYVQKFAHAEQTKPELQRQLFGPIIAEHLKQQQKQVQGVEPKEKTTAVDRDGKGNDQSSQQQAKEREEQQEEKQETITSNASPWAGNIVNVKI